jgi:site-specific recombinase XerD
VATRAAEKWRSIGRGQKDRVLPRYYWVIALHWLRCYWDETRHRLVINTSEPTLFLTGCG